MIRLSYVQRTCRANFFRIKLQVAFYSTSLFTSHQLVTIFQNVSNSQSTGVVYARVQKDARTDEVTWTDGGGGGGTAGGGKGVITVGPPPSLAEQLKQVNIGCFV